MAAHADAAAAGPADIAGRQRDVHEGAVGPVIVVAPDQPLLIGEHRPPARAALLGLGDPARRLADVLRLKTRDAAASSMPTLFAASISSKPVVDLPDEIAIEPSLRRDLGHQRVEEDQIGARIRAPDAGRSPFRPRSSQALTVTVRLGSMMTTRAASCGSFGSCWRFLSSRGAAQVRQPMVEEIVGLRLERVGADGNDRVGELGILVAIVQLAHAHVAGGMDLANCRRADCGYGCS